MFHGFHQEYELVDMLMGAHYLDLARNSCDSFPFLSRYPWQVRSTFWYVAACWNGHKSE